MIFIVHGENLPKSRARILNQQKKMLVSYRQEIDITDTTPEDLVGRLRSIDIFGEPQFFVLNISGTGRTNLENYVEAIAQTPPNTTVVILSEKKLGVTNIFIKNAASLHAQILENEAEFSGSVFDLVDAVLKKDRLKTYKILHRELDKDKDPFELFSMLLYGVRTTAQAKFGSPSFEGLKQFQKDKNLATASRFSEKEIGEIFSYFYELDVKAKSGEITSDIMLTMAVEKVLNSK